ncbi:hypothetical protein ACJVC5_14670 [Peredibacter sp. HCB2-198]|uniref:hypothetical protein n=1 Tax=Peredibacter sp. HCB2-198 TaxID=3383025 RepID=UPI0038B62BAA
MKKLALMLCCLSFAVHAEVITQGGFGIDGATYQSIPLKTSVRDAKQIYGLLNVQADARGKKVIQIADESNIESDESGFMFILRASQKAEVVRGRGLSGTVKFSGKLATELFKALDNRTAINRVGASTKEVANLSCTKGVRPGVEAVCTIKDTNVISLDVDL